MSRSFRKSKKALTILLAIAFVLSFALPVFAATSYSGISQPKVVENIKDAKLGTLRIKIDPLDTNIGEHEAWIELPEDFKVINVNGELYDKDGTVVDGAYYELTINGKAKDNYSSTSELGEQGFSLKVEKVNETFTGSVLDIRISFDKVEVPKYSGAIKANVIGIAGQLMDGEATIGSVGSAELSLAVKSYDNFAEEGNVEIRVTEDAPGSFNKDDTLKLTLPKGFVWNRNFIGDGVFGDEVGSTDVTFDYSGKGGRELTVTFDVYNTNKITAVDLKSEGFGIKVDDPRQAVKGDVIAKVGGTYDAAPDELVVGVYGDYEYKVTAKDAETVYAGRVEQEIADITIEEEVAKTFIANRSVILTLPSWAKWGALPVEVKGDDFTLELSQFYGREGNEARYTVRGSGNKDPDELKFEDMEIVLSPEAPVGEDVVVAFSGSAGVRGNPVVATVAAPATIDVDEIKVIGIGRSNQDIGEIIITEAKAGLFKDSKDIQLMLDEDVKWASASVEVEEGDIALGSVTGFGTTTLSIRVDYESDEPSTIKITGDVTTMRTIPEGDTMVRLRGPAIVETVDSDALEGQWSISEDDWYQIGENKLVKTNNVFPGKRNAAVTVLADVGVPAPPVVGAEPTKVVMNIGSTTYTENGVAKTMDVAPFIENDRTFVPIRFIAEAFGAEADWTPKDAKVETVTLTKGDMIVTINIDSAEITVVEGEESRTVTADVAAQIKDDRTFLPLRAVGEIFGASFDWGPKDAKTTWVSFSQ